MTSIQKQKIIKNIDKATTNCHYNFGISLGNEICEFLEDADYISLFKNKYASNLFIKALTHSTKKIYSSNYLEIRDNILDEYNQIIKHTFKDIKSDLNKEEKKRINKKTNNKSPSL